MKLRSIIALVVGAALFFALAMVMGAQDKKTKKTKEDRISGTIQMMNKDTKTITVRASGNIQRQVVYNDDTKYTKVNKPGGTLDELKDGTRVICLGKFNDKTQLVATRIDIRLPR
jgi:uncharacterized protein YoxC